MTGGIISDCLVDLWETVFYSTYDSRLALLFCLDFAFGHCLFFFRLLPSPFIFFCWLDFDPCIPYDSDSCPALFDLFAPVPHSCSTLFSTLTVTFFCPSAPRIVTPVKLRVSPAGLHPSNRTLFVILLCCFPFLFLKVILGVGYTPASSLASLRRWAEVYLGLFRQSGPELLVGLQCSLHPHSPFYISISLSLTLSRPDPRPSRNRIGGSSKPNCRLFKAELETQSETRNFTLKILFSVPLLNSLIAVVRTICC